MGATVTEAAIRQAIRARLQAEAGNAFEVDEDLAGNLERIAVAAADPLVTAAANTLEIDGGSVWEPLRQPKQGALWNDLRPSQAARLIELVEGATERVQARCEAIVLEELTAAGVQFAAEFPDAPRPEKEGAK